MGPADPYQPPATTIGPGIVPVRRSIWAPLRWFPTAICVIFALFACLFFATCPGVGLYLWLRHGSRPFEEVTPRPGRLLAQILTIALVTAPTTVIALAGARAWMRRRWGWAVAATLLSYLLLVAAFGLLTSTQMPRLSWRP